MSLRVAFARNPPDAFANCRHFPTLDPKTSCPFPGWCVEVIKMIADSLHLSIDAVLVKNAVGSLDWGTLQKNGSWTGVLGYLANNTADTACLFYQSTDLRDQYFELSYPIQPVYVVKRQKTTIGSVLWNAFKPYSYVTWLAILGNTILFIFSLIQSAFFTYLYEGLLLSALIQQGEENPFKDADGLIHLIAEGKYHLVTNYRGNWYFDELDHSNSSHFAKLRAATSSNPVVVAKSVSDALDMVDQGNYIFPIQQDSLAMQMSKERCNFVYVNKDANSVVGIFTLGAIGMSFALIAFVAEIYHFWHNNVLMRKWRANAPLGGVENILAVANIHLNTSHDDRFDLLKLAEYRERIQARRHSRETSTSL
ncbi:hypothetical protein ANCCAN_03461 [Ancylostoma caninum]|uniref:Ligand-gated ion channel n=1 Tax=Ancylostoma caninum TaxID=29170 RepID=A0A368H3U0_ANCCA|nr:hypothetical protein ANCCAN_03461 [Ancylostoma caninum]